MANRDNHYEAAFEEYLRKPWRARMWRSMRRSGRFVLSNGASIESLEFHRLGGSTVAGRTFSSGGTILKPCFS